MSIRKEHVRVPDGTFDLPVWLPAAGHGPGILLIQEIYGVSDYIRAVAADLAGLDDAEAAYQHLASLPEITGGLGIIGFCFGGTIAYQLAPRADANAVVSFYGSGVPGSLEILDQIGSPILFHFGGSDPYIPRAEVARVEAAVRDHSGAEIAVQEEAGHAFHNRMAPMFSQPGPAARTARMASCTLSLAASLTSR
jgi:carboxymethylenebutenolidase